jgi:glycosyltransferase involved in cell wall biosynthesis
MSVGHIIRGMQSGGEVEGRDPVISVVIPARDAEPFVGEAVDSVLGQTFPDLELVVVVDERSSDGTVDAASRTRDPRLRVIRESGVGVARARNAGLAASAGRFVVFLDADDRLRPRTLELLCGELESRQETVVAYTSYVKIDEAGRIRGPDRPLEFTRTPSGRVLEAILEECFVKTPGAALIRRTALERVGAFDPRLAVGEDWELWCRLAAAGEYAYVGDRNALIEYRLHPTARSLRCDFAQYRRTIAHVFGSAYVRAAVPPKRLARLRRRQIAFVCTFLAIQRLRDDEPGRARMYLRRAIDARRTAWRAYVLLGLTWLPHLPRPVAARLGTWS